MSLYIRIDKKQIIGHPITKENLNLLHPNVDIDLLSNEYAKFQKVELNLNHPYKIYDNTIYIWDNNIVKEFHIIRDMTEEEKKQKISLVNNEKFKPYKSWIFNIEQCCFIAPVPFPNDGKSYKWDEETISWVEING